jgi:ankyrin repeat protein
MEAIDEYLRRLGEPGVRDRFRQIYHIEEEESDRKPATRRQVAAAERKLGIPLPPSYKKLVTTVSPYDGGYGVRWIVDPHGLGADIVSANRTRLSPFLIAVVDRDDGDSYCFDTRHPDERGEYPIVHFDHEVHDEESTDFEAVAEDLGAFLLASLPDATPPEAEGNAARVSESPRPTSIRKVGSLVGRQLSRFPRVIATIFAAGSSSRSAPTVQARGPNLRERRRQEMSPLLAAVQADDLRKASELLSLGTDPNGISQSMTPLQAALLNENKDMIKLLIEHGADPRAPARFHQSLLQIASERDPVLGRWMFQQLPDATVIDAAEAGTLDDLRKLVDAGGDVNGDGQDERRDSPLQAAVRRDDVEMAAFLLDRGANLHHGVDPDGAVLFIASTHKYSSRMTKLLLRHGADPNAADREGCTPLYHVAQTYYPDVLETLIRGGADVNVRTPDGSTPLHSASCGTDPESRAIRILVEHGAKLDAQDHRGFTPLHAAMERTMATAATTLLDLGADPTIRDDEGRTPVQLVTESVKSYPGIPEVVRRLGSGVRP